MTLKIKSKIDCCGSDFERKDISFIGMMTFSIPLMILILGALPFLFLIKKLKSVSNLTNSLVIILRANKKLIENQNLMQGLRCSVTATTAKLSSSMSMLIYSYFNLVLLLCLWLLLLGGFYLIF